MRDVNYLLTPEMQSLCNLEAVRVSDVFRNCLKVPISKEEEFQLVEALSDTDTAVDFYSSNTILAQAAQEIVFQKIGKLLKRHANDEGFITSFQVLHELYRMEAEGVPVNATLLMEVSDFYMKQSQSSMDNLLQTAEKAYGFSYFSHLFQSQEFEKIVVQGCYPFTPVSAYLLLKISEIAVQNERTVFTFLTNEEPYSLPYFLKEAKLGDVVGAGQIYDYFANILTLN